MLCSLCSNTKYGIRNIRLYTYMQAPTSMLSESMNISLILLYKHNNTCQHKHDITARRRSGSRGCPNAVH